MRKIASGEFKFDDDKRGQFLGKIYKHLIPLEGKFTRYGPMPTQRSTKMVADSIIGYLNHLEKTDSQKP